MKLLFITFGIALSTLANATDRKPAGTLSAVVEKNSSQLELRAYVPPFVSYEDGKIISNCISQIEVKKIRRIDGSILVTVESL